MVFYFHIMTDYFAKENDDLISNINLFHPFYSTNEDECSLCIKQYLPEFKTQIQTFETLLQQENANMGCGIKTCIERVLEKIKDQSDMSFIKSVDVEILSKHFDNIFGYPLCGYNNLKRFDFFALFDQSNIDSTPYIEFIYSTYKHSRSTSQCPYALLAVYIWQIIENSIGNMSDYKKKHDFLWMYNCLMNHKIRLGKLK